MPPRIPPKLPRLRVHADEHGRITPYHPAKHTEDDWWSSVLSDPRLRSKDTDGWQDNLGRHRGEQFTVSCAKCGFRSIKHVDALIFDFGANCPCVSAAARIQDEHHHCRYGSECGLTYETTKPFTPPGQ